MTVTSLSVQNCRNIQHIAEWRPSEGLTVIAGQNGQGKTNLLECIFLLTGSKSFRAEKDSQLVREGKQTAQVTGTYRNNTREEEVVIDIYSGGEKRGRFAHVNGVDFGRAAAVAGHFTAVVFEPNHLALIKEGPEGRRRFLDAALCQLYPGYVSLLRRFYKALKQKNAVLRQYFQMPEADALLDAFDGEIVKAGGEVSQRRAQYLQRVAPAAEMFYGELSCGAERLAISFSPCAAPQELQALLQKSRSADIRAGHATTGPQREDIEVQIDGKNARSFASQGQQRSAVLSLKLAEAEVARQTAGELPVLLLDDVLSELDEGRQTYLLREMDARQSFVTTCDASAFARTAGQVVHMQNGRMTF